MASKVKGSSFDLLTFMTIPAVVFVYESASPLRGGQRAV
jgi:hypothetical protein